MTTKAPNAYNEAMLRSFLLACVLAIGGGVVAGCGGSVQQVARQKAKQLLGDGHPKLLRIETVQDVGGTREAVVTMQRHFKPQGGCSFGPCRTVSYVWLYFSLSNPKDMQGFSTTSASQLAAIDRAKSANPLFGIFPDFTNPAIRCAIPLGRSGRTIAGGCVMNFEKSKGITRIKFRENWPFVKTRSGNWPSYEKSGGWIVTIGRNGRFQSIRVTGHLPPQLWK